MTGDTGARALFEARPDRVRWVVVDEDTPVDVDRRADLERAEKRSAPAAFTAGAPLIYS